MELVCKIEDASTKFNMDSFFTKKITIDNALILINEKLPSDPYLNYATRINTKGEPEDPYQELSPLYGEFLTRRFRQKSANFKVESLAAFSGKKIVGTAELAYDREIAIIYALAVLPEFRDKGFGKGLLTKCARKYSRNSASERR